MPSASSPERRSIWGPSAPTKRGTGGGVSQQFGLPAYQRNAAVPVNPAGRPGRGVPDVAGDADPATGYRIRVNGGDQVIGGTSAVAPLWAALTALANEGRNSPEATEGLTGVPSSWTKVTLPIKFPL